MQTHLLLSVGADSELMKTRALILLKAGYAVRNAMTSKDALAVFAAGDYDLVLICHTIPESERLELIATIRASRPSAKIIVIRMDGELSAKMADETVGSLDGPAALLTTVADTLGHHPNPS